MNAPSPSVDNSLQCAGPLTDPVKISANWALVTIIITVFTMAIMLLAVSAAGFDENPVFGGAVLAFQVLIISGPLSMWFLLQPVRRVPVFYLRAFRSDLQSEHLRNLLRAALGQKYRLCGIRPPRERVSWLSRFLMTSCTGLRYLGSPHFDLEANNDNWMVRLLASYQNARFAFIDVRDVTTHVADEIRLTYLALGVERSIFITGANEQESEARRRISNLLEINADQAAALKLLSCASPEKGGDDEFVRQARVVAERIPQGEANINQALPFVAARVPQEKWKTPFWEKNSGQLFLGFVAVNAFLVVVPALLGLVVEMMAVIPLFALALAFFIFYFRALRQAWKENRFQSRFRDITAERHPPAYLRFATLLAMLWIPSVFGLPACAVLLPGLARAKDKAQRISCMNNLKQVGLSFRIWSNDYGERFPFHVAAKDGGTMEICDRDENGFEKLSVHHFRVMSNELSTPTILVCPADKEKFAALDFAHLDASNVTYRLRTLPQVTESAPMEVLAVCPLHNTTLYADGSVWQTARTPSEVDLNE